MSYEFYLKSSGGTIATHGVLAFRLDSRFSLSLGIENDIGKFHLQDIEVDFRL